MTANAEIVLEEHPNSLILPEAAVVYDSQKHAFVDLVDPTAKSGRRRMPVTLGVGNGTRIQVVDGVSGSQKIVIRPEHTMREAFVQSFEPARKPAGLLTMFGIHVGMISVVILSAMGEGFRRGSEHVLRRLGRTSASSGVDTSMRANGERAGRRSFSPSTMREPWLEASMVDVVGPNSNGGNARAKNLYNAATVRITGIEPPTRRYARSSSNTDGSSWTDEQQVSRVAIVGPRWPGTTVWQAADPRRTLMLEACRITKSSARFGRRAGQQLQRSTT